MVTRSLALGLALLLAAALPAAATSNHEYAAGEFAPIADAVSPDGRFAVVAHGEGDLGIDNFALHLARRPGDRPIAALPGSDETFLDTAPEAFRAIWAPDSRHVAVDFRADRHERTTALWSVADGRVARVTGADLFEKATGRRERSLSARRTAGDMQLKWLAADRFELTDTRIWLVRKAKRPDLGAFGETRDEIDDTSELYGFAARAECTLVTPTTYRCRKPVPAGFEP